MNYEDIKKANESIKTTPIKGKDYAEVPQRVKAFRMLYPTGCISTEIVSLENGVVIIKATALDEDGKILGVGHAYEKEGNGFINKESYIENCETSAVGRCLGFVGLGIDTSIRSAEEMENAMLHEDMNPNKKINPKAARALSDMVAKIVEVDQAWWPDVCDMYGIKKTTDITMKNYKEIVGLAEKRLAHIEGGNK